jgi:spore germination cell wall hydrolase CwlJ-like protein
VWCGLSEKHHLRKGDLPVQLVLRNWAQDPRCVTPLWRESEEVAKKVLLENFRLPSLKNALYFHAEHVSPSWGKPKIEKIGRHIFYGERT